MSARETVGNSIELQRIKEALQELSTQNKKGTTFEDPSVIQYQNLDYGRDSFLQSFTQFMKTSGKLGTSSSISPSTSLSLTSQYDSENEIDNGRENFSMSPNEMSLSLPASFDEKAAESLKLPLQRESLQSKKEICIRCANFEEELRQLQQQRRSSMDEISDLQSQLQRAVKIEEIKDDTHLRQLAAIQQNLEKSSLLLEAETAMRRTCEEKAARHDFLLAECEQLRTQVSNMKSTLTQQGDALQALSNSDQSNRALASDSDKLRQILALDKAFLQQELRQSEARFEEKARALDAANSKCASLELKVAQLTDQLLTVQMTSRTGFDDRLEKEIHRIREESIRELDAVKSATLSSADRESRMLLEAKQSLGAEVEALRKREDALTWELQQLQKELSALSAEKVTEASELRAELRIKSFELTSLGVAFEERMTALRKAEAELEMTKQEVAAHKTALTRLERESELRSATLSEELERVRMQLRAYEALEEEVDETVLRAAGQPDLASTRDSMLQVVRGLPSSPERRVKQALQLAQRLLEAEGRRDELQLQLTELEARVVALTEQKEAAETALSRAAQPTSYLVNKLREEEASRIQQSAMCDRLSAEVRALQKERAAGAEENIRLRERLTLLLQQRSELQAMRALVSSMKKLPRPVSSDVGSSSAGSGSSSSEESDFEGSEQIFNNLNHPIRQQMVSSILQRTPDSSLNPLQQDHDRDEAVESKGGHELPLSNSNNPVSGKTPPSPSPTHALSLEAAAKALHLSPEILRQMTTPPKT